MHLVQCNLHDTIHTSFTKVLQLLFNYSKLHHPELYIATTQCHRIIFKDDSSVDWSAALQNYTLFMFYFVALKYNTALNQKKTQVIETEEEDKKKKSQLLSKKTRKFGVDPESGGETQEKSQQNQPTTIHLSSTPYPIQNKTIFGQERTIVTTNKTITKRLGSLAVHVFLALF